VESELLHCFQHKVHLTFVLWFSSVCRPEFAVLIGHIASAEALQSTSSLVTTEIAPNSEETPVVQILIPNNSDNDVHLVEPVTETPIQHARKRALSGQQIQAGKLMRKALYGG
jgi:hypothetical protein